MTPLFLALSTFICLTAFGVILSRNPIYSVLNLICCFFGIGGLYLLLQAPFLAIVHIIVYAGAIMVLFLFMLMLMSPKKETEPRSSWLVKGIGIGLGAGIAALIGIWASVQNTAVAQKPLITGTATELGKLLFTEYSIPFELTSLLFLSAVVSIILFGKKS